MNSAAQNTLMLVDSAFSRDLNESGRPANHRRLCRLALPRMIEGAVETCMFSTVGDALTRLAERAYAFRRPDLLGELGRTLISLPLGREYNSAGRYFSALACLQAGNWEAGGKILSRVVSEPSHRYTSRALQSLGAVFHFGRDYSSALKLYVEAGRRSIYKGGEHPLTTIYSQQNIAIIKGKEGDHHGAVEDLERLVPFGQSVGLIYPQAYYFLLNGLAVELNEVGRHEQAHRFSEIAFRSPIAPAYPEWGETFRDIQLKLRRGSRSIVAVSPSITEPDRTEFPAVKKQIVPRTIVKSTSLVPLPERPVPNELPEYARTQRSTARVLDFQQWKERAKSQFSHATALSTEQRSEMTIGEKLIRLMDLISHDDTDDQTIDVILEAVEAIVIQRRGAS